MSNDILFLAEFAGGTPARSALELATGAAELLGHPDVGVEHTVVGSGVAVAAVTGGGGGGGVEDVHGGAPFERGCGERTGPRS